MTLFAGLENDGLLLCLPGDSEFLSLVVITIQKGWLARPVVCSPSDSELLFQISLGVLQPLRAYQGLHGGSRAR